MYDDTMTPDDCIDDETARDLTAMLGRLDRLADSGESELFLADVFVGGTEGYRKRLRLKHPDSGESDISPALPADEMVEYLSAMCKGYEERIEYEAAKAARCQL